MGDNQRQPTTKKQTTKDNYVSLQCQNERAFYHLSLQRKNVASPAHNIYFQSQFQPNMTLTKSRFHSPEQYLNSMRLLAKSLISAQHSLWRHMPFPTGKKVMELNSFLLFHNCDLNWFEHSLSQNGYGRNKKGIVLKFWEYTWSDMT